MGSGENFIRLEVKVVIPDNRKKEDFLKLLLDSAKEDDSLFWQTDFDVAETERASIEAVLGKRGFPFLQGNKLLTLTCDFASKKQEQKAYNFFRSLAVSWDLEINEFTGTRMYSEILDLDDFD
jgi:hypothetical protein